MRQLKRISFVEACTVSPIIMKLYFTHFNMRSKLENRVGQGHCRMG